jgi:hypothetical protein
MFFVIRKLIGSEEWYEPEKKDTIYDYDDDDINDDEEDEDEDHKLSRLYFVPSAISIGNN